jgi:hypothetical protein
MLRQAIVPDHDHSRHSAHEAVEDRLRRKTVEIVEQKGGLFCQPPFKMRGDIAVHIQRLYPGLRMTDQYRLKNWPSVRGLISAEPFL